MSNIRFHELSVDELRDLQQRAVAELTFRGQVAGSKRKEIVRGPEMDFARDLYEAFAEELQRRHKVKKPAWEIFATSAEFEKEFKPAAAIAFAANSSWFPKQSKQERVSMARLYAGLCIDALVERGMPLFWGALNWAVKNLPELMDQAYPGYAAAGMLGMVQKLRTRGH